MTAGAGPNIARAPTGEARPDARAARFAIFLELERAARAAEDPEALGHRIVHDTRRLLAYRTACLLRRQTGGALRVAAISDVASHDPRAPVPALADRIVRALEAGGRADTSQSVPREGFGAADLADWDRYLPAHLMWTPFKRPDGTVTGGVLYGRDTPFGPADLVLADQIADAYGHADAALARARRRIPWPSGRRWLVVAGVALALLALLAVPVRQTALAPAEVVAADPAIVAAPADGVLTGFAVTPGESVAAGRVLFRLDDTMARAQRDVAERNLGVAEAELRRATQSAFADREAGAQIEALAAQVALRRAELTHAGELLERIEVRATRDGVVVLADPRRWIGKPVRTGERILEIADPARVEMRADVPVGQAIALEPGARVALFLDTRPLQPLAARLISRAYEAEPVPGGGLAYRAVAAFPPRAEGDAPPRIGLRGTARLEGRRVPLALYLFGRPLAAARQFLGR